VVFATVGTDHHPFDRLIGWMDGWLDRCADRSVSGLVQSGTSAQPRRARGVDYLGYDEMEAAMGGALAVVTHGGPGSIMLCSYLGKRPIVVPRQSALGEHVDDHQVAFSRRIAAEGKIDLAESEERFFELLDAALARGASSAISGGREHVDRAVRQFGGLVDDLLSEPARPRRRSSLSALRRNRSSRRT
jgi:UDP-N-acetylglucosamine transferase subunit ALG13